MLTKLIELGRVAERDGRWEESLRHYEAALARVAKEGTATDAADLFRWIGRVHTSLGEMELAIEAYDVSLTIAEQNQLETHFAAAQIGKAVPEIHRGNIDFATSLCTEGRSTALRHEDERLAAAAEQNLGVIANIRGDVADALRSYNSALQHHLRLGETRNAAYTLNNMGMAHVDLEQYSAASDAFDDAHRYATEANDVAMAGSVRLNRAELYLKRQQFEDARESCEAAIELFGRLKARARVGEAYKFYGILYRETSRLEQAGMNLAMALGLAQSCENILLQAETETEWALVHVEEGREDEAIRRLNRAYQLFHRLQAKRDLLDIDRRLQRLTQTYTPMVQQWSAQAVESHDPWRAGQTQRVLQYSTALAEAAGIGGKDMTWLQVGASVHDVGNTRVPGKVLGKRGGLSRGERELVQSHTVMGEALVSQLDFPDEVQSIVRHHHERWDGKGYPDKLGGEDIPLNSRIVAVADVYGALTTDRSWRPAYGQNEALAMMEQEAGKQFDPELFGLFREVVAA